MYQKNIVEEIKINILCSVTFLFENHVVSEIMWKKIL